MTNKSSAQPKMNKKLELNWYCISKSLCSILSSTFQKSWDSKWGKCSVSKDFTLISNLFWYDLLPFPTWLPKHESSYPLGYKIYFTWSWSWFWNIDGPTSICSNINQNGCFNFLQSGEFRVFLMLGVNMWGET